MKKTIAYTSIEQIVVGDYKFNCDEYHFYDNEITAREEIEDLWIELKSKGLNKLFLQKE